MPAPSVVRMSLSRVIAVGVLAVAAPFVGGCGSDDATEPKPLDPKIKAVLDRYAQAFSQEDIASLRRVFVDAPLYRLAGDVASRGRRVFTAEYRPLFRSGNVSDYGLSDLSIATGDDGGTIATARYRYRLDDVNNQGTVSFDIRDAAGGPKIRKVTTSPDLEATFDFPRGNYPVRLESTWRLKDGTRLGSKSATAMRAGVFEIFLPLPARYLARLQRADKIVLVTRIRYVDGTSDRIRETDTIDFGG